MLFMTDVLSSVTNLFELQFPHTFDLMKSAAYELHGIKIEKSDIVTFAKRTSVRNPIEFMHPEKLCDNLRRSVV